MNHPDWKAPLGQILNVMFNIACTPCVHPRNDQRCAKYAKGDMTYMCYTCQARQLRFGVYCDDCKCNHTGDC